MGKRTFVLIVGLMSISLIGIIALQVYWISNAIESKEEQFKNDVQKSLGSVSEIINEREREEFDKQIDGLIDNIGLATNAQIKNYFFQQIDTTTKQRITFGGTFLEKNFKLPTNFLDNDTIILKRVSGKQDFFQTRLIKGVDNIFRTEDQKRYSFTKRYKDMEKPYFSLAFEAYKKTKPLHKRVRNRVLNAIIKEELEKRNINLDFKYGIYSRDGLATKLKSGYYTINKKDCYRYPFFLNLDGMMEYELYVTFPTKNKHILSGISSILILSLFFILIIVIAFSSSLYQLLKQKKISEIKTDFINNMTHEFKTPIATINLALDSIKNPKIINDNDKILRYVKMIRDENKRMHSQVENVLRISRLEKNQIDINKEAIDMHDIIDDAITRISLLIADSKSSLDIRLEAKTAEIIGNQFHLTNVVVNILENAIKYSNGLPKIDIFTETTSKFFIFKIKDTGIGMSKATQNQVFNKFYREQKGNIHNVKGHGLGLAYVKEIIDKHHGDVLVESEKGIGSVFTVKLPLI
jgi:two-component system phosphate regulon sensor histidine kinase PhoR